MSEPSTNTSFKICVRCLMDTTSKEVEFDETGTCNFCNEFERRNLEYLSETKASRKLKLQNFVNKVKVDGSGKKYDCVIGVSGGLDSSWALVCAVKSGLRPLAVHMDNGWNSELAQNNISNLVRKLDVDLYTHVIDWEEYRNLMEAFFKADVINIELLYDNAMLAVNFFQAKKYGVKNILAGTNQATEGMKMPSDWNWFNFDKKNIKAIAKSSGIKRFKTFPSIGITQFLYLRFISGVKWHSFLDYVDYVKSDAIKILQSEYGYKPYKHKHSESIFTRYYQGHILPSKFGVDKRKLHLSNLILSNQLLREEGLKELERPPYNKKNELEEDEAYFLKKMGWTTKNLEDYLKRPEVFHDCYSNEKKYWDTIMKIWHNLSPTLKTKIKNL